MPKQKRLDRCEVHYIMSQDEVKQSNIQIAEILGVTEGAIRYRKKREASGESDHRKEKPSELIKFTEVISDWVRDSEEDRKRPALKIFYNRLIEHYGYKYSYDALRRYMRKHFPEFYKKSVYIRIETPPGALIQADWKENIKVQIGEAGRWVTVHAMIFTLAFSRKTAVIFNLNKDLDAFISSHQKAFNYFGGLSAALRTDCLKSAITQWKKGEIILNERYANYMNRLGIEAFPARPGKATDKGKVEKRIQDLFSQMDLRYHIFKDLNELQEYATEKLENLEKKWRSGATGLNVEESFAYEKKYLKKLPEYFPLLPIKEQVCRVNNDGTVHFCNNNYQISGRYRGQNMLCINTGTEIILYHDGEEIERYAYLPRAQGMVMISEKVFQDESLQISQKVRNWALEVAHRQVELYYEISQGGKQ
jgi:transposase